MRESMLTKMREWSYDQFMVIAGNFEDLLIYKTYTKLDRVAESPQLTLYT